jgi:SAM-dependent methyltransferase
MMTICPVCRSSDTSVFDRRECVSILQNRLYDTAQAARGAPTGQLAMAACNDCSFVWNAAFDSELMKYDPSYENDQSKSAVFKEHLQQRVERILEAIGNGPDRHIIEVGCGQGDFLAQFAAHGGESPARLTGFDPAWRGSNMDGPEGSRIFRSIFSSKSAESLPAPPDAIVSRHTIEHIPDPVGFLRAIRDACGGRRVQVFLETPCANWIVSNLQFQDLFYEHCSIFTKASLSRALTEAGLSPGRIEHVFGGQYLWAEAWSDGSESRPSPAAPDLDVGRWSEARSRFIARWKEKIEAAAKQGPVYVWGVGAKGVTFALLTDPDGNRLAGAVDVNPKKQSLYIPLTGLRVIAPGELPTGPFTAIVMNPNYLDEIAELLKAGGREATLLSIAE